MFAQLNYGTLSPNDFTMTLRQKMALMPGWIADIVIDVPPAIVWQQVTNFEAYREWNPFVLEAQAEFQVGSHIRFLEDLKQFGQHWLTAKFLAIEPPHRFVWQGHFAAPWLFTVRHTFTCEQLDSNRTRFVQQHQNFGLLVPYLAWRGVYEVSSQGYAAFNQALKERCECKA